MHRVGESRLGGVAVGAAGRDGRLCLLQRLARGDHGRLGGCFLLAGAVDPRLALGRLLGRALLLGLAGGALLGGALWAGGRLRRRGRRWRGRDEAADVAEAAGDALAQEPAADDLGERVGVDGCGAERLADLLQRRCVGDRERRQQRVAGGVDARLRRAQRRRRSAAEQVALGVAEVGGGVGQLTRGIGAFADGDVDRPRRAGRPAQRSDASGARSVTGLAQLLGERVAGGDECLRRRGVERVLGIGGGHRRATASSGGQSTTPMLPDTADALRSAVVAA